MSQWIGLGFGKRIGEVENEFKNWRIEKGEQLFLLWKSQDWVAHASSFR